MAIIMDGLALAAKMKEQIKEEVAALGFTPGLTVIIVGDNPASRKYVDNKKKDCAQCGIKSREIALPGDVSGEELLTVIRRENADPETDGILVQLPLPAHIDETEIIRSIDPEKDVDAFHPVNTGRIMSGDYAFLPCTPAGVMALLDEYGLDPSGRECVVVGRSNIVGKPQALMLLKRNGTVTVCHTKTADIPFHTRRADILVCAVGRAGFLTADMVKPGAAVIDVGMNVRDGKLCGDADFEGVSKVAGHITPAPGGVGPMTRVMLLKNTLRAAKSRARSEG